MGCRRGASLDRGPHRRAARTRPPRPHLLPAAHHRGGRAAAADRAVQDRRRTPAAGQPRTRRRAGRRAAPDPGRRRRGPAGGALRRLRVRLVGPGAAAVPTSRGQRAPGDDHVRPAPDARRHPGPHRPGRPGDRRPAALPARLPADVPHRRDRLGAAPAHRPGDRRPPGPQRHPGLQGGLPDRGDPGPPGVPRPPSSPAAQRGVPHAHRRGVAGVPRPLRAAPGLHRHLRPRVRHPLPARTRLHLLPGAAPGPPPAPPARRDPRQPARPHRQGRTGRLARRGRRAAGQPRRRPGQALPARPAPSRGWSRRAGNAAAARCRPVVSPPDPGQHQTRSGTYLALWPVDPDASWPAAHAAALDDLTRLTALAGVVLVGPPTFTCCEPPGWSGPLGTPGDLLLVAVAAVRAAAADERTPAPTGSPSAQYLPADVTVRERGVGERAARLEALTRLLRTGLTTEAIAVRTGLSTRTLDRLRVAVDNPSP